MLFRLLMRTETYLQIQNFQNNIFIDIWPFAVQSFNDHIQSKRYTLFVVLYINFGHIVISFTEAIKCVNLFDISITQFEEKRINTSLWGSQKPVVFYRSKLGCDSNFQAV